jgi:hypothetical protein
VLDDTELARFDVVRLVRRGEGNVDRLVVPQELEASWNPGARRNDSLLLGKRRHRVPVDADDAIAHHEFSSRRLARNHDPDRGRRKLAILQENGRVQQHGEEDVHRRPRKHDDDPFPERLGFEGALLVLGKDGGRTSRLFEHPHESAERDEGDAVFGLLAAKTKDLGSESNRKREHLDAEDLRKGEVSELVHEDQRADEQREIEQIHGSTPRALDAGEDSVEQLATVRAT